MVLIDANPIIRIILNDNAEMRNTASEFIKSNTVLIRNEVMAEIAYVLAKVYNIERDAICKCISSIMLTKNITVESQSVMECALDTFKDSTLDFVDCLLYAYHLIDENTIFTFDKKLNNRIKKTLDKQ